MNHAVTVVGYSTDADSGLNVWIVRNHWGDQWVREGKGTQGKGTERNGRGGKGREENGSGGKERKGKREAVQ